MLGWSINLFRVFGIQLSVHSTFFLLLAYAAYEGWSNGGGLSGLLWSLLLVLCFFFCVLLHELGHSLTARRYGVLVPRILLLPIGGMAEFDRVPRQPSAEFLITIAGPAVNFVIAACLLPFVFAGAFDPTPVTEFSPTELTATLFWWNLVMGIFNLVPVYPMDGGRILRSILALYLPYLRATWWAVVVARVVAPLLAAIGYFVFDSVMLPILFLFILYAGTMEYRVLLRREQEAAYWAEAARRIAANPPPPETPPPVITHGPN